MRCSRRCRHVRLSAASPRDQDHSTTMRRGFHTLKARAGWSGLEFGEAGWAMEQVLNLAAERGATRPVWTDRTRAWPDGVGRTPAQRRGPRSIPPRSSRPPRASWRALPALESGMPDVAVADMVLSRQSRLNRHARSRCWNSGALDIRRSDPRSSRTLRACRPPLLRRFAAQRLGPGAASTTVYDRSQAAASARGGRPGAIEADLAEAVSDWPARGVRHRLAAITGGRRTSCSGDHAGR
jgi:hypothetical protein